MKREKLTFDLWKTIKLGTGLKTARDFRKAIRDKGMRIGNYVSLSKSQFKVAIEETEVDLVVVSVAELGFENGAIDEHIYARVKELGLDICPPEVGPQLRLQYKDQPKDERLIIGMERIADSGNSFGVFCVEYDDDDLWLSNRYCDYPYDFWGDLSRFVFVLPRK